MTRSLYYLDKENISIKDIENAIKGLIGDYNALILKLYEKRDFLKKLLGVNLNKVLTSQISGYIETINGKILDDSYNLLNDKIVFNLVNIISLQDEALTHSKLTEVLKDSFLLTNEVLTEKLIKKSTNHNLLSVKDLNSLIGSLVFDVNTIKNQYFKDVILKASNVNEYGLINVETFKKIFFVKDKKYKNFNVAFNDLKAIMFQNTTFDEIILDYTDKEITGSGCNLSATVVQEAVSPTPYKSTLDLMYIYAAHTAELTINGETQTYDVAEDDTGDIILDSLLSSFSIDGMNYELVDGYYMAAPQDDNGDRVFCWTYLNKEPGLDVRLILASDNSSEHDLLVDWDSDNYILTVTYASDGADTLYPTIGELINAIADAGIPWKVYFIAPNVYTTDDEYTYETGADGVAIEQTMSTAVITCDTKNLDISSNPEDMITNTITQNYSDGKRQVSEIDCVRFERGYIYYVKIDNSDEKKVTIDTTDNNNDTIVDCNTLINEFKNKLTDVLAEDAEVSKTSSTTLTITFTADYDAHTVETSGEQDYQEPLPRDIVVAYDLKDYVFKGQNAGVLKKPENFINDEKSPVSYTDFSILSKSYLATSLSVNALTLINENGSVKKAAADDTEPSVVLDALYNIQGIMNSDSRYKEVLPVKYIMSTSFEFETNMNFPAKMKLEKFGIYTFPKNTIMPRQQLTYALSMTIEDYNKVVLSYDDNYHKNLIQLGSSLYSPATINDLLTTPNTTKGSQFLFKYKNPNKFNQVSYGRVPDDVVDFISSNDILLNHEKIKDLKKYIDDNYVSIKKIENFAFEYEDLFDLNKQMMLMECISQPINLSKDEAAAISGLPAEIVHFRVKHFLMDMFLMNNSQDLLGQLIDLLNIYFFDLEDILMHIDDDIMQNVVLELDNEDTFEVSYGLDEQPDDITLTFADLYIRGYKHFIKRNESEATVINSVNNITENDLLTLPKTAKAVVYSLIKTNLNLKRDIEKDIVDDSGNTTGIYVSYNEDTANLRSFAPFKTNQFYNVVGEIFVENLWSSEFFLSNLSIFKYNSIFGISDIKKITVWESLIDTLYIKNYDTIYGVKDSVSQIKELYAQLSITPYLFALMLSLRDEWTCENNALVKLFFKIYESMVRNGIASDSYEDFFKKTVGIIFKNDETATDILPYELFEIFLNGIGVLDTLTTVNATWNDDSIVVDASLVDNFKLPVNDYLKFKKYVPNEKTSEDFSHFVQYGPLGEEWIESDLDNVQLKAFFKKEPNGIRVYMFNEENKVL